MDTSCIISCERWTVERARMMGYEREHGKKWSHVASTYLRICNFTRTYRRTYLMTIATIYHTSVIYHLTTDWYLSVAQSTSLSVTLPRRSSGNHPIKSILHNSSLQHSTPTATSTQELRFNQPFRRHHHPPSHHLPIQKPHRSSYQFPSVNCYCLLGS